MAGLGRKVCATLIGTEADDFRLSDMVVARTLGGSGL
jgi:hypothetical protein